MKRDADRERSEMSNLSICREEYQCTLLSVSQVYFTTTLENTGKTPILLQCRTKCFGSIVCLPWAARNCAGMVSLIEWGKEKKLSEKKEKQILYWCTNVYCIYIALLRTTSVHGTRKSKRAFHVCPSWKAFKIIDPFKHSCIGRFIALFSKKSLGKQVIMCLLRGLLKLGCGHTRW